MSRPYALITILSCSIVKKITWLQYANHTIISLLLYFFLGELNSYHRNKKNQITFKNVYMYKIVYIICRCFFIINYGTNLNYVIKYSFLIEYVIPGKKPNIYFSIYMYLYQQLSNQNYLLYISLQQRAKLNILIDLKNKIWKF